MLLSRDVFFRKYSIMLSVMTFSVLENYVTQMAENDDVNAQTP